MEIAELIAALRTPAAFPGIEADRVEVIQTHISAVFLVGEHVFKVKKPVRLPFVDYGARARRRAYCEAEVALNRRLAPDVYLGVVDVTCSNGQVTIGGPGEVIDHAVHMRRLPDDHTLAAWLDRGALPPERLRALAGRLAAFHRGAARGPSITPHGDFEAVAGNVRDNFSQMADLAEARDLAAGLGRLRDLSERELARQEPRIRARAARGVPCDGHGDLRLDHVYLFPEAPPPGDLLIIDCVEFNASFRAGDPAADLAFLVMDLRRRGAAALADALVEAYVDAAGDRELVELLPLYVAYRATVRTKVELVRATEPEVGDAAREEARALARRHLLVALAALAPPGERPALVLVAGLPGAGKSTLARNLAEEAGFTVIRSDVVRKRLAGLGPDEAAPAAVGAGLYSPSMTEWTYAACLADARARLLAGERVIIDANLRTQAQRRPFVALARSLGVPCRLLVCEVPEAVALARIAGRRGDASDADAAVYHHARATWEPPEAAEEPLVAVLDAAGTGEETLAQARAALTAAGIATSARTDAAARSRVDRDPELRAKESTP